MKLNMRRVRKALVAAGAAAAGAFGAGLAEGLGWRAAAGWAAAAAIIAGFGTYKVPNKLSYAELRRQLDEAAREGR